MPNDIKTKYINAGKIIITSTFLGISEKELLTNHKRIVIRLA
jgi:hypothetical protein